MQIYVLLYPLENTTVSINSRSLAMYSVEMWTRTEFLRCFRSRLDVWWLCRCKHETVLSALGLLTGKRGISIATECRVIANLTLCRLCDFAFSAEIRFAMKKFPCDIKMKYASNESQILCEFQIYYTNQTLVLQPCALFQGICPFTHFHPAVSGGVNVNAKVNKLTNF